MKHIVFSEKSGRCKIAILIKESALRKDDMTKHYVDPLIALGVDDKDIVAFSLDYNPKGKAPAKLVKEYVPVLLRALDSLGTEVLYVADATYFKSLTGCKKADPNYGYVLPCKWKDYEHIDIVLGTNYGSLFHNPLNIPKLEASLKCLASCVGGYYREPGEGIIEHAEYPSTVTEIAAFLDKLHQYPELTADFEAFSLKHYDSGIGTAAFAWNEHEGGAFLCDYRKLEDTIPIFNDKGAQVGNRYGKYVINTKVRELLRNFFVNYKGKIIWHNMSYDVTIAVYNLFMCELLDRPGLVYGLEVMTKDVECTKLISYLATNACTGNELSLKTLGQEFAGNYAEEEIHDITKMEAPQLLEYNLVDCLTTWFTRNKFKPIMIADGQQHVFDGIFLETASTIIEMQLTGMPLDMGRVKEVKQILTERATYALDTLMGVPDLQSFIHEQVKAKMESDNLKLKAKKRTYAEAAKKCEFNPGSTVQLAQLFYVHMGLPVIDKTKTKKPACGAKTIKKLLNHCTNPEHRLILESIRAFAKVEKILNTFIPAFEKAQDGGDGRHYLFGSFNLGGTFTGRLSSSGPNMQNLPSSGEMGALVKSCFMAPSAHLKMDIKVWDVIMAPLNTTAKEQ